MNLTISLPGAPNRPSPRPQLLAFPALIAFLHSGVGEGEEVLQNAVGKESQKCVQNRFRCHPRLWLLLRQGLDIIVFWGIRVIQLEELVAAGHDLSRRGHNLWKEMMKENCMAFPLFLEKKKKARQKYLFFMFYIPQ